MDFTYQGSFTFTARLNRKYTQFSDTPFRSYPHSLSNFPVVNILYLYGILVTIDDSILVHYYYLKSTGYIRVHFFGSLGLWFFLNDDVPYSPLQYLTVLLLSKSPLMRKSFQFWPVRVISSWFLFLLIQPIFFFFLLAFLA